MSNRSPALAAAFALAACLIAPLPGLAAQDPQILVVEDGAIESDGSIQQTTVGVCVLETAPRIPVSYNQVTPNYFTSFAWRIPTSNCTACPAPQNLLINSVSLRIRWFSACTAQAEVLIVGATGPAGCRVPDPNNVLCGPAIYPVSGAGSESVLHTLPLTPACCVTGEAFALVRYIGTGACAPGSSGQTPGIGQANMLCATCDQYYTSSPGVPSLTDWCIAPTVNKFWMEVDADCCVATDLDSRSWGRLKTIYR